MRSSGLGREIFVRGGLTLIIAAITYFFLDASPWVWLIPLAVVGLVAIRWVLGGGEPSEEDD